MNSNPQIWEHIYAEGHRLSYPNDICVRILNRILPKNGSKPARVLDYGFGSGELIVHLAQMGCETTGVEVSASAVEIAQSRLKREGLQARVVQIEKNTTLPFSDQEFDLIVSWQVLNYQTPEDLQKTILEFERILKPDGKILVALMARGDFQESISKPIGHSVFEIQSGAQKGAQVILFDDPLIKKFFGSKVSIDHFSHSFQGSNYFNKIVLKSVQACFALAHTLAEHFFQIFGETLPEWGLLF